MATTRLTQTLRKSHAMGPSVRNLLNQYKLDPSQIVSTGPHQILLKNDVLSFLNQRGRDNGQAGTSQQQNASPATWSSSQPSVLSAEKPLKRQASQLTNTSSVYSRRTMSQLEIDVINSGGLLPDPQEPKKTSR